MSTAVHGDWYGRAGVDVERVVAAVAVQGQRQQPRGRADGVVLVAGVLADVDARARAGVSRADEAKARRRRRLLSGRDEGGRRQVERVVPAAARECDAGLVREVDQLKR